MLLAAGTAAFDDGDGSAEVVAGTVLDVRAELDHHTGELVTPARAAAGRPGRGPTACQSLQHSPVASTRTTAPRGGHCGSGTSASSGRPPNSVSNSAFTGCSQVRQLGDQVVEPQRSLGERGHVPGPQVEGVAARGPSGPRGLPAGRARPRSPSL